MINGVSITTTCLRTRGTTPWRIDPTKLVSAAVTIPSYDGGSGPS
uniref:Uncharacterized protein n=1 Tax=uncultured prokaryote TaxID=198431 RepID=A0A0H5Q1P4_9ZZZZ|nr:hypothetical protein [uncultured prokaryote]